MAVDQKDARRQYSMIGWCTSLADMLPRWVLTKGAQHMTATQATGTNGEHGVWSRRSL